MGRKTYLITFAVCAALVGGGAALYLRSGMETAEVLRKLAGMRLALEFYRQEKKELPLTFAAVTSSGKLEGIPLLKLPGHLRRSSVREASGFTVTDTGGWAYVSDKASPNFGLVFIDCAHKDAKGRYWSEF